MSTHTPGPWIVDYSGIVTNASGSAIIATMCDGTYAPSDPNEREANVRLIEASPDLYDALKECSFRLAALIAASGDFSEVNAKAIDAATAALQKAEGAK